MNNPQRLYRKVIRIAATDSPNVRLALSQIEAGMTPTGEVLIPGVITWDEYQRRLATWDEVRICIGIHGQFYEGAQVLMYPPAWLNRAEQLYLNLRGKPRIPKAIGIDPAEGGDKTSMAVVDEFGLIELLSRKTPDTNVISGEAVAFMRRHNVRPENVVFDSGGGGKHVAQRLHSQGLQVRMVAFGEPILAKPRRGMAPIKDQIELKEEKYIYKNRRAEMYGTLRRLLDPAIEAEPFMQNGHILTGFAISPQEQELRRQLAPIPLTYDGEGRMELLPKHRRYGEEETKRKTLVELIGHSPDEADSVVLAIHAMLNPVKRTVIGAMR